MRTAPRRRSWIWFFLALVVLGTTALTIEIGYNLIQQLTAPKLEAARATWRQNGPADYDFTYTVTRQAREPADVLITFQSGRVAEVAVESSDWIPELAALYDLGPALAVGVPVGGEGSVRVAGMKEGVPHEYRVRVRGGRAVEVRCDGKVLTGVDPEAYSMEGLFAALGRQLELDAKPGRPRVFAVGTFGKGDRRVLRYVRSCRALRERVEIKFVDLK
jgi:hypothetical protein